jgi:hypothetical protein
VRLVDGLDGRKEDISPFTSNYTFVHKVLRRFNVGRPPGYGSRGPGRGSVVVKALCYKPEGREFEAR